MKPIPTENQMELDLAPTLTPEEEQELQHMLKASALNQGINGTSADDIQAGGSHYKDMGVQPWTVMEALLTREEFIGYLKGNLVKYGMRQGKKDSPDAEKWHHYNMKLKEVRGY
jgi:hypothetical protein